MKVAALVSLNSQRPKDTSGEFGYSRASRLLLGFLLCAFLGCHTSPRHPGSDTAQGWLKSEANPVLGGWRGLVGTVGDMSIIHDERGYRMWATWRRKKGVGLFRSIDGAQWSTGELVLGPASTGWEDVVDRPTVLKRGGVYHMWYTGQARGHSSIGYAKSGDGQAWVRVSDTPVLAPGLPWEKVAVMCPYVTWDEPSGVFRMWYSGGEQYEPDAIGYATSADGIHWEKWAENPIFRPNPDQPWERHKVAGAQVLRDGDWYYMFYIGFFDTDHAQIGLARSRDGITQWQRSSENPAVRPSEGGWDRDACYKPFAVYEPRAKQWMLWYNGRRGQSERIGLVVRPGASLGFK